MAESTGESEDGGPPANAEGMAAAIGIALDTERHDASLREDVRAFMRQQTELTRVQLEHLHEQRLLQLSHFYWRRLEDLMQAAQRIIIVLVLAAIAIALGAMVWQAHEDHALVIEAFSVPPDLAARGMTGQVVATQIQDRLAVMQARTVAARPAGSYTNNWGGDIKIEIPETGVSVGELYRYLAAWLGHQTRITGEVYHGSEGVIISARAGEEVGGRFTGPERELNNLVTKAAEYIYRQTQPYRYATYLLEQGRIPEVMQVAGALALDGPREEQPWAYTVWGLASYDSGDPKSALERMQMAAKLGPDNPVTVGLASTVEPFWGHDQSGLDGGRRYLALLRGPEARQLIPSSVARSLPWAQARLAEATGDYGEVARQVSVIESLRDYLGGHRVALTMLSGNLALNHDVAGSLRVAGPQTDQSVFDEWKTSFSILYFGLPATARAVAVGDWQTVRAGLSAEDNSPNLGLIGIKPNLPMLAWPWLAFAEAKLGDFAAAHARIDRTPRDCYLCVRMRARIDAEQKKYAGAEFWFAEAVRQGPSLPFAWLEWGQMLMARGDADGAIAKYTTANRMGPHFADPLEAWGEALMAKNQSHLALAKFEEANSYAPHWGRLHLKWGEALAFAGKTDGAKAQFAHASQLDLTPSEKSELARMAAHV